MAQLVLVSSFVQESDLASGLVHLHCEFSLRHEPETFIAFLGLAH